MQDNCLKCGKNLDTHHAIDRSNKLPEEGDFTICFYCEHVMIFDKDLSHRELTESEKIDFEMEDEVFDVQMMLAQIQSQMNKIM